MAAGKRRPQDGAPQAAGATGGRRRARSRPVPREPGLLEAHSPRCHWSCSRSPSPRSCQSRWCSPTQRCWNVLRPRLPAAPAERCGASERVKDPREVDSFPPDSLPSLPIFLLLERRGLKDYLAVLNDHGSQLSASKAHGGSKLSEKALQQLTR